MTRMTARPLRQRILAWGALVLGLLVLALGAFPWGLVARHAGGPLSKVLGRPVEIGSARRLDWFSFVPTIELDNVRVGGPAWTGSAPMASVRSLAVRVPVFPLLFGHVRPNSIVADGIDLHFIRNAAGRENWSEDKPSRSGGGGRPAVADLVVRNSRVRLDDAKHGLALVATFGSDQQHGLRIVGRGTLHGSPLTLLVAGPSIAGSARGQPYPAQVSVTSRLASLVGTLRMERPLELGHFTAHVRASGHDLGYLDDIIWAGLFRTQPFRLTADLHHDGQNWAIPRLDATIGRTNLHAVLNVTKPHGRTRLDGQVDARTLDFDDFASDEQKAHAAAEKARTGPRLVPGTRIVLDKVKLDGRLEVGAAHLLSQGSSPFRSLTTTVSLDDRRLMLSPLVVGLPRGRMTGSASVDSRDRTPRLALDLRISGATVEGFFPGQQVVAGPLAGRLKAVGVGLTVRDALSRGNGRVAFVVEGGSVRQDYATFLGGDVFKSVGAAAAGKGQRTSLDCLVASFALERGRMIPHPLLLSTPVARGDGNGSIVLGPETIDLRVIGRPTRPGPLLSTAPVRLFGTLSQPRIDIRPPRAESQKQTGLGSRLGFFIKKLHIAKNAEDHAAPPVNCHAEVRHALL